MRLRKITYALFIIATICLFTSCKKECKHQSIEWVIDKQATCTEEGIEHEECTKCHEKFDIKEIKKLKHICNDEGICTICGNKVATSGLIYKLNEDKKSYYVSEYIGIDIDIIIPAKYDGLYVTSIGDSAFSNFIGLTSIEIPNSVISIRYFAFSGCTGLTSLEIPASVINIEDSAFSGCQNLTSIIVDKKNQKYDSRNDCNAIIDTQTNALIMGCKNTIIPEDIKSIGVDAFYKCTGLTSIKIPDSVISIRYFAFSGCTGLTSLEIPASVINIEDSAFSGCQNLTSIIVDKKNQKYDSRNDCNAIIDTQTNALIMGCKNTIIPEDIKSIGVDAFYKCTGLTSIKIPDSVKTIGTRAFNGCTGLTSIEIPSSVTIVDYCAFDDCDNISYNIYDNGKYLGNTENPYLVIVGVTNNTTESFSINPNTKLIGGGVFSKCRNLKSIEIPDGVTSIGVSAFNWCGSLKSIKIPDSVTSIGNSVFSGCTSLKSIEIPNSVTSIGDSAFRGCINLTSIIIPNSVTSMGDEVFNMCKAITVYCEALEKPSGWSEWWNYSNYGNCYVVWGYKKN